MMGGDISVESVIDEGTCFTVELPTDVRLAVQDDANALVGSVNFEEADSVELPSADGSRLVVVIDDDPGARELMARYLTREGFQVATAPNGGEGLKLVRELKPSAITLDVMMPGMDGWCVLDELKNDPELAGIPVVMCTIVDEHTRGYALGATDYLTKPVDRQRLINVIARSCDSPPTHALVVDDEPSAREVLVRTLDKAGIDATEASNGVEALERLAESKPNVILTDLMMPEMDGFEFLEELRKDEDLSTIPVVVVTAKELTEEERAQLNFGVEKVIQKGAHDTDEMVRAIGNLVSRSLRRRGKKAA